MAQRHRPTDVDLVSGILDDIRRLKMRPTGPGGPWTITHTWVMGGDFDATATFPPLIAGVNTIENYLDSGLTYEQQEIVAVAGGFSTGSGTITVSWKAAGVTFRTGHNIGHQTVSGPWFGLDNPVDLTDGDLVLPVVTAHTTTDAVDVFLAVAIRVTPL